MRILVTGDRNWREARLVYNQVLAHVTADPERYTVIHGDARGADTYAEVCAQLLGVPTEPHPAKWELGRGAGVIRNQEMLDSGIDLVLAFHHDLDNSRGTKDMVARAEKHGVEVVRIG